MFLITMYLDWSKFPHFNLWRFLITWCKLILKLRYILLLTNVHCAKILQTKTQNQTLFSKSIQWPRKMWNSFKRSNICQAIFLVIISINNHLAERDFFILWYDKTLLYISYGEKQTLQWIFIWYFMSLWLKNTLFQWGQW